MKIFVLGSIILISAALSPTLLAADEEYVWMKKNRRSIAVGVFFVEEDTEVRLSSDILGPGSLVAARLRDSQRCRPTASAR